MTEASRILSEATAQQERISGDRRFLHAHAETRFDLNDTLPYVRSALEELGIEPKPCGKAGLTATVGGKRPGKVFLLRADMDALPIGEQAEVPFRCDSGNMHACGHDMHTAMLLGAARILKAHEEEIPGTVKLMFQPAEETFEGSLDMLNDGLLENPAPDAALMIHVMAGMPFAAGTVVVSAPGVSAPAADYFEIRVQGKGCHGSAPNLGVDPLNAAAHLVIALQEIHARELAMTESAALTIGTFRAGTAANAIPDEAVLGGTLRTYDEETRAFIKQRIGEIAEGTAKTFRCTATVTYTSGAPTLKNDAALSEAAFRYATELLGPKQAFSVQQLSAMGGGGSKSAGSEDFAYVSQRIPAIMLALAAGNPAQGYAYPGHHPMVRFDEAALAPGSAVYAYCALRWLEEHA
ncbi:MAG: M20 family metallopeptidase [Clostridia bacterium]|nr:M20 family metallopeptidase [Clostridia bacterium]